MSNPQTIHGLSVLSKEDAASRGFKAVTTNINSRTEKAILAGVCQHRNPERSCLIDQRGDNYQLALLQQDVSDLKDRTVLGF